MIISRVFVAIWQVDQIPEAAADVDLRADSPRQFCLILNAAVRSDDAAIPKVKWLIRIDPVRKCVHVNLVKRTKVPGEERSTCSRRTRRSRC